MATAGGAAVGKWGIKGMFVAAAAAAAAATAAEDGAGRPGRPLLRAEPPPLFLPPLFECFSIVLFNTFGKSSILVTDFSFEGSIGVQV